MLQVKNSKLKMKNYNIKFKILLRKVYPRILLVVKEGINSFKIQDFKVK